MLGMGPQPGMGIRMGAVVLGSGWLKRYINTPGVLFFGLYSEIADGRMPNKVEGSTDYLTVTGDPGAEVYTCPDTAEYLAADTDIIWFDLLDAPRNVTTAELIGYDLQRTPVRYTDDEPNSIEAIMILSADLTGNALNMMFRDFRLHPLWNDEWNSNGVNKSNRGLEQLLWTPE